MFKKVLELKRFDFDFEIFQRVKLNDRVTFPELLDMNLFLNDPLIVHSILDEPNTETGYLVSELPDEIFEENEKIKSDDIPNGNEPTQNIEEALKNGPYVYELHSVIIHMGSGLAGHYKVYIKSFINNKWYEFNDTSVREIPANAYTSTFGNNSEKKLSPNGTAYLLTYRLVHQSRNRVGYTWENLPEYIKQPIEEEIHKEIEKEQERQKSMITVKITFKDSSIEVKINKNEILEKIRVLAVKHFNLEKYYPHHMSLSPYLPGEPLSEEFLKKTLGEIQNHEGNFYVEVQENHEEFPEVDLF